MYAAEGWERLKLGMTSDEALAAIGTPLMRSAGKGFEIWIYDQQAEVVFYGGPLVAWTSPATAQGRGKSVDVWQRTSKESNAPTYVLPPAPLFLVPRWDIYSRQREAVPSYYRYERRR